jgi:cytochrome P450
MRLPPGPRIIPSAIQTLAWCFWPYELLSFCDRKYGDVFTVKLVGDRTYVVFSHPDPIRDTFAGLGSPDALGIGNEELRPMLGDNSLFLLDGDRHRQHRQHISPTFRPKSLPCFGALNAGIVAAAVQGLKPGDTVPVMPLARGIGVSFIVSVVFGLRTGPRFEAMREAVHHLITIVNGPLVYFALLQHDLGKWSPGGRVWRARAALLNIIDKEIAERRREPLEDANLLDALVVAEDDKGHPLSNDEIRDELLTVLLAGHDPTTAAAAWALYWIHKDASILERLRAEVESSSPEPESTVALPYLDAVCQETLRLYPIVPAVERIARVPVHILGYDLPVGVHLTPCIYLTHHRPDIYPQPQRFRPERFLERTYTPYEYLPFGGGTRRCIGAHFAPYQIKLVLASLMRSFRFELVDNGTIRPIQKGATIAPSAKLALHITDSA